MERAKKRILPAPISAEALIFSIRVPQRDRLLISQIVRGFSPPTAVKAARKAVLRKNVSSNLKKVRVKRSG